MKSFEVFSGSMLSRSLSLQFAVLKLWFNAPFIYRYIPVCNRYIYVYSRMLNVQILSAMECIVWGSFSPKFMLKFKILMINHYKLCFYYLQINALCVLFFISKSFFGFCFLVLCVLRSSGMTQTATVWIAFLIILTRCFHVLS